MPQKKPTPRPAARATMPDDPYADETIEEYNRRREQEMRQERLLDEYLSGGGSRGYASGMYGASRGPETEFIQGRPNTLASMLELLTANGGPRGFASNVKKYSRSK